MPNRTRDECNKKNVMNENADKNDQNSGNDDMMIKVRLQKMNVEFSECFAE